MKAMVAVAMLTLLGASNAGAVDIKDKWGIGAGVIDRGGEISLIRGHSERSAWLFNIAISGRDDAARIELTPPEAPTRIVSNDNRISILAGPGYRRFVRPGDSFSPYWDIHVGGRYQRDHRGGSFSDTSTMAGAEGGFSFGLEYFTRWHFSVAAHSDLLSVSWLHVTTRQSSSGSEYRSTGHNTTASIGLAPAIFVRGYF